MQIFVPFWILVSLLYIERPRGNVHWGSFDQETGTLWDPGVSMSRYLIGPLWSKAGFHRADWFWCRPKRQAKYHFGRASQTFVMVPFQDPEPLSRPLDHFFPFSKNFHPLVLEASWLFDEINAHHSSWIQLPAVFSTPLPNALFLKKIAGMVPQQDSSCSMLFNPGLVLLF